MNVLLPWLALQGLVVGTADGRWVAAEAPGPIDEDEALATLGRRYLAGYGPAGDRDLAAWSGLPVGRARRALELAGDVDPVAPAEPPACALLAAFDTLMLGWESREPLVAAAAARQVLPGGRHAQAGRAGRGAGRRHVAGRAPGVRLVRPGAPTEALDREVADVERFLAA